LTRKLERLKIMSIKIILADDHEIMRQGLCSLLEKRKDVAIIAEACNGREAVKLAIKHSPDMVIMDVTMPDLNGIEATRQIVSEVPGVKVIALSMHSDEKFVTEMLKAGASGYLLKDDAFEELDKAISAVAKNQIYMCVKVADAIAKNYVRQISKTPPILTPREREVLQVIAEGKSTKEIASILNVSIKTVESHRKNIMEKLDLYSIAELTKYAIRQGITSI
jgi:DNA-binding NarL/FixJ family response regulator